MQSQTKLTVEVNEQYEYWVSRFEPQQIWTEETSTNEAPSTAN